jgi:hypothetical protein
MSGTGEFCPRPVLRRSTIPELKRLDFSEKGTTVYCLCLTSLKIDGRSDAKLEPACAFLHPDGK